MGLDPKELIDIPGAGRAEVACRAMGAWDESRAPGAGVWRVEVWATVTVTQTVTVSAETEEEAERLAVCQARADQGEWVWERAGDVEPEGTTAWEARA